MIRSIKNSLHCFAAVLLALMFAILTSVSLHAQEPGDIRVHFSTEVAVPDHLLPAGDYTFRRVNADDPHTYAILTDDGQREVAIVHVLPAVRVERGDTEVQLSKPDAAGVSMVKAWYDVGDSDGYELVYSKKDQRKLDELAHEQNSPPGSLAGQP